MCRGYFKKYADVCIPETPPPLMSANVCNWVPPPPQKLRTSFVDGPLDDLLSKLPFFRSQMRLSIYRDSILTFIKQNCSNAALISIFEDDKNKP